MRKMGLAAVGAAITLLSTPASAEVFWSNFDLGTGDATLVHNLLPLDYRTSAESFSNGSAAIGVSCSGYCLGGFEWYSVQFEFTVDSSFTASNAIVGVQRSWGYGDQRLGFAFEHYDSESDSWDNFGGDNHFQINGGNLPTGQTLDAEVPFGTNATGGYGGFSFRPISFVAGETYRVTAGHWAGGIGITQWMLSDVASASATAGSRYDASARGALGFQPTLALTDGQGITFAAVPEPATWAMLILGFGVIGAGLRSARASALHAPARRLRAA